MIVKKGVNKILKAFSVKKINQRDKSVYLTFDDGPEEGITGFVLNELGKYGFKATFFCRGDNAEKNSLLLNKIIEAGHSIGNHSYSHPHAYLTSAKAYLDDVQKADNILHSQLYRPPYGSLTLTTYPKLARKYRLIFWSLNSDDANMESFELENSLEHLRNNTHPGSIVLFHFCQKHEQETRKLLPEYLLWLNEHGYNSLGL